MRRPYTTYDKWFQVRKQLIHVVKMQNPVVGAERTTRRAKGQTHLTELLRRCARLPEIGKARVNDWVFQNGDFVRHRVHRSQVKAALRDE
jgi:hypothetical protein